MESEHHEYKGDLVDKTLFAEESLRIADALREVLSDGATVVVSDDRSFMPAEYQYMDMGKLPERHVSDVSVDNIGRVVMHFDLSNGEPVFVDDGFLRRLYVKKEGSFTPVSELLSIRTIGEAKKNPENKTLTKLIRPFKRLATMFAMASTLFVSADSRLANERERLQELDSSEEQTIANVSFPVEKEWAEQQRATTEVDSLIMRAKVGFNTSGMAEYRSYATAMATAEHQISKLDSTILELQRKRQKVEGLLEHSNKIKDIRDTLQTDAEEPKPPSASLANSAAIESVIDVVGGVAGRVTNVADLSEKMHNPVFQQGVLTAAKLVSGMIESGAIDPESVVAVLEQKLASDTRLQNKVAELLSSGDFQKLGKDLASDPAFVGIVANEQMRKLGIAVKDAHRKKSKVVANMEREKQVITHEKNEEIIKQAFNETKNILIDAGVRLRTLPAGDALKKSYALADALGAEWLSLIRYNPNPHGVVGGLVALSLFQNGTGWLEKSVIGMQVNEMMRKHKFAEHGVFGEGLGSGPNKTSFTHYVFAYGLRSTISFCLETGTVAKTGFMDDKQNGFYEYDKTRKKLQYPAIGIEFSLFDERFLADIDKMRLQTGPDENGVFGPPTSFMWGSEQKASIVADGYEDMNRVPDAETNTDTDADTNKRDLFSNDGAFPKPESRLHNIRDIVAYFNILPNYKRLEAIPFFVSHLDAHSFEDPVVRRIVSIIPTLVDRTVAAKLRSEVLRSGKAFVHPDMAKLLFALSGSAAVESNNINNALRSVIEEIKNTATDPKDRETLLQALNDPSWRTTTAFNALRFAPPEVRANEPITFVELYQSALQKLRDELTGVGVADW